MGWTGTPIDSTAGAPRRAPPRPITKPIPMQEPVARYRQGTTLTELATTYAVTRWTVRRKLAAAGVPLRSLTGAARRRS